MTIRYEVISTWNISMRNKKHALCLISFVNLYRGRGLKPLVCNNQLNAALTWSNPHGLGFGYCIVLKIEVYINPTYNKYSVMCILCSKYINLSVLYEHRDENTAANIYT